VTSARWPRHPLLYEINTRVWLRELSARAGRPLTLAEVPAEEIDTLAGRGFDAVWLMGVWTTGPGPRSVARRPELRAEWERALPDVTEEDIVGSPYAVTAYDVSPRLGGQDALAALRARLAAKGLRLFLDFVANHTALDHPRTLAQPEAFVRGTAEDLRREPTAFFRTAAGEVLAHGRDPLFPPWIDTAQVHYGARAGRDFMRETLLTIAEQCDGVRCDMAMLLLPEVLERTWGARLGAGWVRESFWSEAIPEVLDRHPGFRFLAEVYWGLEERLQGEGFHFTYDKTLYDRLRAGDTPGVRSHLAAPPRFQERCCRFVENHDERRAVTAFGLQESLSAAAVTLCAPGMRLLHEGQLEGRAVRLPVQLARRPAEPVDETVRSFYERLLGLLGQPTLKDGRAEPLTVRRAGPEDATAEELIALAWRDRPGAPRFVVVVNLGAGRAYGRLPLAAEDVSPAPRWTLRDLSDGESYLRETAELIDPGLFVALDGRRSHLFELSPATTT
jgi:alpha amylase-like protein